LSIKILKRSKLIAAQMPCCRATRMLRWCASRKRSSNYTCEEQYQKYFFHPFRFRNSNLP